MSYRLNADPFKSIFSWLKKNRKNNTLALITWTQTTQTCLDPSVQTGWASGTCLSLHLSVLPSLNELLCKVGHSLWWPHQVTSRSFRFPSCPRQRKHLSSIGSSKTPGSTLAGTAQVICSSPSRALASVLPTPHGQKAPQKKIRVLLPEESREEARQAKAHMSIQTPKGMTIPRMRIHSKVLNTIERSSKMTTKSTQRI